MHMRYQKMINISITNHISVSVTTLLKGNIGLSKWETGRWFGFPKLNRISIGIFKFPVNYYLDVIARDSAVSLCAKL